MSRRLKTGSITTPVPSSAYIAFLPCFQAATDTSVIDRSGKGNNATLGGLSTGEAWAVANRLSSLDSSGKAAQIPAVAFAGWTSSKSFLVSVRATVTKEGAQAALWGNGAGGSNHSGIALRVSTTGALSFWGYKSDNTSAATGATTETPYATAVQHAVSVAYDGVAKTVVIYIDGVRSTNFSGGSDVSAWIDLCDDFLIDPWFIGGRTSGDVMAGTYHCYHMLMRSGALPANIDSVVNRLYLSPAVPVSESEFPS